MAFNTLEYLRDGKVDFVYHQTPYDYKNLIESVRKAPNRIEIINGFLPKLRDNFSCFCFEVIYDIPEFADVAYELFDIKNLTPDMLQNALYNSPLGFKILDENFDKLLSSSTFFDDIVQYLFESNNRELIHRLSRYPDLHIRYLFMDYLIKNHPDQIDTIYGDITKYTTSVTYEENEQLTFLPYLMDSRDISKLAVLLLKNNRNIDYKKIKDFILREYKTNYLASELLAGNPYQYELFGKKEGRAFKKDADKLFETSADYRYAIYLRHKSAISEQLQHDFAERIKYFHTSEKDYRLDGIYHCGLGPLLEEWTEKYMDLSKSKEYGFIGKGTTCSCFRIGDYVIKLVDTKWSYEDTICPNIYLIAKNYEEIYLRNSQGIVDGGLEVQKYLTRKANHIDPKYFRYFDLALERLGYRRTDSLTGGVCGDNTMLLDTYRDADCPNPEKVPVWFRKYPIVLVDRDRIYPKEKEFVKQLRSYY